MILKQLGPCDTLIEVNKDPYHEHQNLVTQPGGSGGTQL